MLLTELKLSNSKTSILDQNHPKHKQFEALSKSNLLFNFHLHNCYIACAHWDKRLQEGRSVIQTWPQQISTLHSSLHIWNRCQSKHLIALNKLYLLSKIQLNTFSTADAAAWKLLQHSLKSLSVKFLLMKLRIKFSHMSFTL